MTTRTVLQDVGEMSLASWRYFMEQVEPHRIPLWRYCRKLTGSPWDAEDLFQDTLLKSFASLVALSHRNQALQTKPFLFRVATNQWIDECRKRGRVVLTEEFEEFPLQGRSSESIEVSEAIEVLVRTLPPRQAVVFILTQSFQFSAREVAELLSVTEGAVNAMLSRARTRIERMREGEASGEIHLSLNKDAPRERSREVQEFIDAYNERDFHRLADLLIEESSFSFVTSASTEYGKGVITKYSLNPTKLRNLPSGLHVDYRPLFGQTALIYVVDTNEGQMLYDVNTIEWVDGKISHWKCYYFCREFLQSAAEELGMTLHPVGDEFK